MSLSDMGARLLPKGSDWWRRCLDPFVFVLEPSDWFRELSLREFKVSWRCIVADWVSTGFLEAAAALLARFGFDVCCWVRACRAANEC